MLLLPILAYSLLSGCAANGLHSAVESNDINRAQLILAKKVDVRSINTENKNGLTPLSVAAINGHTEMVKLLIKHGADVNHLTNYALHGAAFVGHTEIVKILLENGATVDAKKSNGNTPLMLAAKEGHVEVTQLLIKHGADVNHLTKEGSFSLIEAAFAGHTEIVKILLENGATVDAENSNGVTPLILAAKKGHVEMAQLLIKHGADVNHRDQEGNMPLILASSIDISQILLSAGANVDAANNSGYSALINMSRNDGGTLELAKLLVENGADINRVTQDGQTAFKLACQTGKFDVATYFYEKGASINYEDSSIEGIELNGAIYHVLGDYSLAQDNLPKAQESYVRARSYYKKSVDKYSGDVTRLAWKQFGAIMLRAFASAALSYASSYQANMQSRQFAEISAMKYATKTHTGIQGYSAYMSKYNQTYVPTYRGVNIASLNVPSDSAPLDERKAYAEAKAKHYEDRLALIDKVLSCFDKNSNAAELHVCVRELTIQEKDK